MNKHQRILMNTSSNYYWIEHWPKESKWEGFPLSACIPEQAPV